MGAAGAAEARRAAAAAALAAAAARNPQPRHGLPAGYRARLASLHSRAAGGLLLAGGALALAAAAALLLLLPRAWPVWLAVEGLFLAIWYRRKRALDRVDTSAVPAGHCALAALGRFRDSVPVISRNYNSYDMVSMWFHGAPFEAIKRENVRELLAYGFGYRTA
jgi:hypothetical protein